MRFPPTPFAVLVWLLLVGTLSAQPAAEKPALASWNDTPTKKAILDFVEKVTKEGSPDFIPVAERIAVFDNDGTLWCEQPIYFQLQFAFDRIKALSDKHPEWKVKQPYKAVLEGDLKALKETGTKGLAEIIATTHTGMTIEEFQDTVRDWIATARHPKFQRPYTECVYQPMIELLAYLRGKGFKTFIVSGGSSDFMRPWTEKVYGIPPEQVVGSSFETKYELKDGKGAILIEPKIDLVDDKAGKPVGIARLIGRRPILAFGNSDGDFEMLEYTTTGKGPRLGLIVHHTDAEREFAYDRNSSIGRLARGLDEAPKRGWIITDMKRDWKTIFPPVSQPK